MKNVPDTKFIIFGRIYQSLSVSSMSSLRVLRVKHQLPNLTDKGKLFHIEGRDGVARKLTLDGVTLVGVPDNDSPLIIVNGGELVMVSDAISGNTASGWGGVSQTGGSAIVTGIASRINTDDTLIAIPAR